MRNFLYLFMITTMYTLGSLNAKANTWSKAIDQLRNQLTSSAKWASNSGVYITFLPDGTFQMHEESEPVRTGNGKYTVTAQKLVLNFREVAGQAGPASDITQCTYIQREHPYKPRLGLKCDKSILGIQFEVFDPASAHEPGFATTIDRESVTLTGALEAVVNTESFFRKGPTVNSKFIPLSEVDECVSGGLREVKINDKNRLYKGLRVTLIAKSVKQHKIGSWQNHWYYINITTGCYGMMKSVDGWLYGEFLDISH
jgi:hypothetical protein